MPPTNTTPGTATDLGALPVTGLTQNVHDAGTTYEVYYKFTAPIGSVVVGLWGFGDLTVYTPRTRVYDNIGLVGAIVDTVNRRVQFPVSPGTVYYLRFTPNAGNPSPAVLNIDCLVGPTDSIVAGDIFVNNDFDGKEAVLLSPSVDYEVRKFVNGLANGEAGDILDNGISLVHDQYVNELKLYDTNFATIATKTGINISSAFGCIRTCKGTQRFWFAYASGGTDRVRYIEDDGTLGPEHILTAITTVACIAVNNDETILYWIPNNETTLKRWDLITDTAMSDLVADTANYNGMDILILEDDTIIFSLVTTAFGTIDVLAKRYNAAGALQNTYSYGANFMFPGGTMPRLAYANDSPNSFWYWHHLGASGDPDRGLSKFINTKVSDGSTIGDVLHQEYEDGIYQSTATTASPRAKFGPPFSCPFFIIPSTVSTGTIIVNKVTIPADATLFDIVASGGAISPTNYQLSNGGSQTHSGLAAGTYSITETANALYDTVISVSDGSPNTAIVLSAGETVTVTITNTLKAAATALLTVGKVTDPLNLIQLFSMIGGGGLSPVNFALHSEESINFNVIPGTYSVVETVPGGFQVFYMVSNDPVLNNNLAIVVGANDIISVIVLNQAFGGGLTFPNPEFPSNPPTPPGGFPPGTGKTSDTSPSGVVSKIPKPFAVTAFVRDI